MKAITCSQCGALIKKISLKEKFAVCDYCGAKILLQENKDKIVEIPDKNADEKKLSSWQQYRENYKKVVERSKQYDAPDTSRQEEPGMESSTIEVVTAEAISGHPILQEAAENAVRKTLFTLRPKPMQRTLIYDFQLMNEKESEEKTHSLAFLIGKFVNNS